MSAKPTPGPWRYWKCAGGGPDADYVHIAAGSWDVADVRINSVTEDDLRLMVAAPELLAALSDLLAMCRRQDDFNDDGDGGMYDRADAAIYKATGR